MIDRTVDGPGGGAPTCRFVLMALLVIGLAACARPGASTTTVDPVPAGGVETSETAVAGEVVVSAAASLTEAFTELADVLEDANPGTKVSLNLAGSQILAAQIIQGAPVDVFASANQQQMSVVLAEGLADRPVPFASNRLAIAVAPGNPLGIQGLADLRHPGRVVVLAAPEVPAGGAAAAVLEGAGIEVSPASLEPDVRAALSKVELGEADAAVVYTSDITARAVGVDGVPIPEDQNVTVTYPIVVPRDAPNPAAAEAFVALVLSDEGQRVLMDNGFGGAP